MRKNLLITTIELESKKDANNVFIMQSWYIIVDLWFAIYYFNVFRNMKHETRNEIENCLVNDRNIRVVYTNKNV